MHSPSRAPVLITLLIAALSIAPLGKQAYASRSPSTVAPHRAVTPPASAPGPGIVLPDATATASSAPGAAALVSDKHVEIAAPPSVLVGAVLLMDVTMFNTLETSGGPYPITGVTLTILLPSILINPALVAPEGWTCDDPEPVNDGLQAVVDDREVTCQPADGTMEAGSGATVQVEAEAAEPGTATVTVEAEANEFDPDTGNNTDQVQIAVEEEAPVADLSVDVAPIDATLASGDSIAWTVAFANDGPDDATKAGFVLRVDGGQITKGPDDPSLSFCDELPAQEFGCSIGDSPAGETREYTIVTAVSGASSGAVRTAALAQQAQTLTGEVSAATDDPDETNNTDDGTVTVEEASAADLSLTKTASRELALQGGLEVDYSITVVNHGPDLAEEVVLTDDLPTDAEGELAVGVSWDLIEVSNGGSCDVPSNTFTCAFGDLAPGDTATVVVPVYFRHTGTWSNAAAVTASTPDPAPENNSDVVSTGVTDGLLRVEKMRHPGGHDYPEIVGAPIQIQVLVTNTSSIVADNVVLTDELGDELSVDSIYPNILPLAFDDCDVADDQLVCTKAALGPGEVLSVTYDAVPQAASYLELYAVSASDNVPGTERPIIFGVVEDPFAVSVEPESQEVAAAEEGTVSVTVENGGDSTVTLRTRAEADDGVEITGASTGADGACEVGEEANEAQCAEPVETGEEGTATFTFTGVQTGTHEIDLAAGAQTFTATVEVRGEAQPLDVEVTVEEAEPVIGTDVTYTVDVTNPGTEPAPDVVLESALPVLAGAETALFRHESNSLDCPVESSAAPTLVCELGTLAPDETRSVEVEGQLLIAGTAVRLRAEASSDDGRQASHFRVVEGQPFTLDVQTANLASEGDGSQMAKRQAAFDVYVDSVRVAADVPFGSATGFLPTTIRRTAVPIQVVDGDAPDNTSPLLAADVNLLGEEPPIGEAHAFVITGSRADPDLLVKRGAHREAADAAGVEIFLAHAAPDAPAVDASLTDYAAGEVVPEPLVDSLGYGQASAYVSLDPSTYNVDVTATDGGTVQEIFRVDLGERAGEALALVLSSSSGDSSAVALSAIDTSGTRIDGEVVTSTDPADGAPLAFALYGGYPNPVEATTTIRYELPKAAAVRLAVYDVLGRRVATLVDESRQPAGRHEATFDAQGVPPGVYFYQIETRGFRDVKKMVVVD